ncbi:hypothetical protein NQ315_004352 [Exocentrus adspersus]|uniref:Methyltransferase-like protein 17, mitochondrial n=1 Tax=Exocentrus adspersus TaxID=1586481 RepID=A0AAV8W9G3_9CUCU|nr:hypothetical protein NQ315_004352 [Exocentrus adspersus]
MIPFKRISYTLNFIRNVSNKFTSNSVCQYSAKIKPVVTTDETVLNDINNSMFKPRKHPGIVKPKTVQLPEEFVKAVVNALEDRPVKALAADSRKLFLHLKGRNPPIEKEELNRRVEQTKSKVLSRFDNVVINTDEEERRYNQMAGNKMENILRKSIYNWRPIRYDSHTCMLYLMARSAAEYAVLIKIFSEISGRDPEFKPRSLFDFGSGIGTATWAANAYWKKQLYEYVNIDASREMNDLAQILLQGGRGSGTVPKNTFYRQFLPATKSMYDLVISAYSMMELPSLADRLQTIINLWNKTERYLIIVEQGTNAGFKIVNELRDYILQVKSEGNEGHVFSPCPNDETCPRFLLDDGTPCNFQVNYYTIPVGQTSVFKKELYSYVVLKKGKRTEPDIEWPRIVRPTLVRPRHTICRVCTAKGELKEVIFTAKKHGKVTYHCARASEWGDRLPLTVNFEAVDETNCDISEVSSDSDRDDNVNETICRVSDSEKCKSTDESNT